MLHWAMGISRFAMVAGLATAVLLAKALVLQHPILDLQNLRPGTPPVAWRSIDTNQDKLVKEAAVASTLKYTERFSYLVEDLRVEEFNKPLQYAVVAVDYDKHPTTRFLVHGQKDGRWTVIASIIGWRFSTITNR